jgi:hypothetical protein
MSSDAGTTNSGVLRVIPPGRRFIPYRAVQDEERSRLLSKIDSLYREACSRIGGGGGGVPSDVARLLVSGVVVGLLDPVSNILVNTLFTSDPITHPCSAGPYMDEAKLGEMVRRSLDGLVAFIGGHRLIHGYSAEYPLFFASKIRSYSSHCLAIPW